MEKTAVIYSRVSTDEQKEQGFSLQDQEVRLRNYCVTNGYTILAHYQDDHSAKDFNRPQFNLFLKAVCSKQLQPSLILVTKSDRFSRDVFKTHGMIELLSRYGITVFSLAEGEISFNDPHKFFPTLIQAGAAQYDNILRAENTKRGMRQALKEGKWVWRAPIGYKNDKIQRLCIIDTEVAPFIKEAFQQVSQGVYSCEQVRKNLAQKGFKCSKNNFLSILRNPFYIGKIRVLAWKDEPSMLIQGNHEPLIQESVFMEVQKSLRRKKLRFKAKASPHSELPLRGRLKCKLCGGHITGSASRGRNGFRHVYYHCQKGCKERFRADLANIDFVTYLDNLKVSDEVLELYYAILDDVFTQSEQESRTKKKHIEQELTIMRSRGEALLDKLISGELTSATYENANIRIQEQISKLSIELETIKTEKSKYREMLKFSLSLLKDLPVYYENAPYEVKQKIIGSIFNENLVYEDRKYRTTNINSVVELITRKHNHLETKKEEQPEFSFKLPCLAPPLGLEPRTP